MALLTLYHAMVFDTGRWRSIGAYFTKEDAQAKLDSLPGFCGMKAPNKVKRVRI
jgi:hypothetical protein